ncbi:hypothetical protein H5410_061528 [Solanum commersonii]|uniref:Polyprotein protein n=1 Tax=Solanum commersonii TaxID=4109 RepID=A0A9J5W896_SOLCO|nr:hypothetical protein H5410_061528 [Solanum commersonii]
MILKMGHLAHSIDVRATQLEGESFEVTGLKVKVADLKKDVDYLKSTDFTSLLEAANDVEAQPSSEIPPITIENVSRDDVEVDGSESKIDEEQIEVRAESIYGDLPDLEKTMVQSVIQTSLIDTSMAGPSGAGITTAVTLGTDAHDQTVVTLGTDAPTDGATI